MAGDKNLLLAAANC